MKESYALAGKLMNEQMDASIQRALAKASIRNLNVRLPGDLINRAKSQAYAEGKTLQEWIALIISQRVEGIVREEEIGNDWTKKLIPRKTDAGKN